MVSGLGSFACTAAVAAAPNGYVAGFALVALGFFLSGAAPAAYGMIMGTSEEQEAGVTWVVAASYAGYAVGPPAMGALAGAFGFRATMVMLVFVTIPIIAAALTRPNFDRRTEPVRDRARSLG